MNLRIHMFRMRWAVLTAAVILEAHAAALASDDKGETIKRETITMKTLLGEMVDQDRMARTPAPPYTCRQSSSYDRASVAPDKPGWFANADFNHFLRSEQNAGRTEQVMLDADGPGCIVRIWVTSAGTGDGRNVEGMLRVYIDGAENPLYVGDVYELLARGLGGVVGEPWSAERAKSPGYGGGVNFFLPILYARHCKITLENPSGQKFYYQINYRTYPAGTPVESSNRSSIGLARRQLEDAERLLRAPERSLPAEMRRETWSASLKPGERVERSFEGPGALRLIKVRLKAADRRQAYRSTILKLQFDAEQPTWVPVGDFFGSGVGVHRFQTWWRKVEDDGTMSCYWVMPFRRAASVQLENLGKQNVEAEVEAGLAGWQWDDRSMYFHANWNYRASFPSQPAFDWNYVEIAGQGVLAADTQTVMNTHPWWWGEGDEKIYVDGETFPSTFGTGTEDYYGWSQGVYALFDAPFHALVHADGPDTLGHATNVRDRMLDAIPFAKGLKFDMEIIHHVNTRIAYGTTAYWYGLAGAKANHPPMPDAAAAAIPEP